LKEKDITLPRSYMNFCNCLFPF